MTSQAGKVAWITGASSGLGEAMAKSFIAQGGSAILSGRNEDALDRVAQESGGAERCFKLPFETTDYDAIPSLAKQAIDWQGKVDVLVNNAGISQRSLAVDTDLSVYQRIIDVDLLAPIALTKAVLPAMIESGSGDIINISSVAGKIGAPMRTAYSAAKHGLVGFGDALRTETSGHGLRVLNVAPGSVRTDVSRNALTADGSRRGKSDKAIDEGLEPAFVAETIWQAMDEGKREIVVAEGLEANMPEMRAKQPDEFFDLMDKMVAQGYVEKMNS